MNHDRINPLADLAPPRAPQRLGRRAVAAARASASSGEPLPIAPLAVAAVAALVLLLAVLTPPTAADSSLPATPHATVAAVTGDPVVDRLIHQHVTAHGIRPRDRQLVQQLLDGSTIQPSEGALP